MLASIIAELQHDLHICRRRNTLLQPYSRAVQAFAMTRPGLTKEFEHRIRMPPEVDEGFGYSRLAWCRNRLSCETGYSVVRY